MNDQELKIEIQNDELIIRIGISTLAVAARNCQYCDAIIMDHDADEEAVKITDEKVFAESILLALKREEEDGTTLVHKMLDSATEYVVEYGENGIEIKD